jgi:3-hydroxyisobutyrate dehydrogenase-like beta-hydroxyacid dehydrogenase
VALDSVGVVGLGNMGSALASNLVAAGLRVVGHDAAGPDRAPAGVGFFPSVTDVVQRADLVVFSLPNGNVSKRVAREVMGVRDRRTTHIVDTSTIGVAAARAIADLLAEVGVGYVDAPVSGGVAGARARTLAIMYAGSDEACTLVEPVLAGLSDRRYRVGDRPGLGQGMKLANNFLSATALAATSEAIAFGRSIGLDMATMLEVLGASSGQNTAVSDKFPSQVLTGRYASGFSNSLMLKDLQLYLGTVRERGGPESIGAATASVWAGFEAEEPGTDFTRIYPYVAGL